MQRTLAAFFLLLLLSTAGCSDVAGPDWFTPGTARAAQAPQRDDIDPYPDPNTFHDDGSAAPRLSMPPPEADRDARSVNSATGAGVVPDRWQASGP